MFSSFLSFASIQLYLSSVEKFLFGHDTTDLVV